MRYNAVTDLGKYGRNVHTVFPTVPSVSHQRASADASAPIRRPRDFATSHRSHTVYARSRFGDQTSSASWSFQRSRTVLSQYEGVRRKNNGAIIDVEIRNTTATTHISTSLRCLCFACALKFSAYSTLCGDATAPTGSMSWDLSL